MTDRAIQFRAGERWRYRTPPGFEPSRIVIGAVVSFAQSESIVCCAVLGAPRLLPDGRVDAVTIPFLPLTASALAASVVERDGEAPVPDDFGAALALWQDDERGLAAFTVEFEGRLDLMIARQMADIVRRMMAKKARQPMAIEEVPGLGRRVRPVGVQMGKRNGF